MNVCQILVEITMKLTHFHNEILPLNLFYMLRLGNMGKTRLMGVELLGCHLNKGLLETHSLLGKGTLLNEALSQEMYKRLL